MTFNANSSGQHNGPGFDEDSPDLEDPDIDPTHPPVAPKEGPPVTPQKRVDDDQYPPYEPDA